MSASYVYNGDGLRVSKTVSSTTTDYTWDQTGIGQVISDGNDYVWGLGLISQITSGTPTYAHSDGLGDTRLLTDSSGSVVGTQQYDAFGATRSQSGTQLPFTYTGEQFDPESGLVYLRARYLDPSTGRFQTPDPLGFLRSGVNLYAYAGSNPIAKTDPSGLDTFYQDAMFECAAQGWSCQGMPQGVAADIMFGGSTEVNPFDPKSVIENGSPADQAFCALTFLWGGGEEDVAASAVAPEVETAGTYTVDVARDANGAIEYVGITKRAISERAREQLRALGINIEPIEGLEGNLTRGQARSVEQTLIEKYGLGKEGGSY